MGEADSSQDGVPGDLKSRWSKLPKRIE